ncbi:hypothetical protein LOTGIDRAFT_185103 [Lottia gigantea]|uniref:Essential MCU regulator, mitochondrial n=1 Tax=Lottia gigantea TaxID=225164 RepID=V4CN30_LOTGI|nr:hypothetical protein LOTGIDRAFT_185103 [Lottia gigantea]ESP03790.1 hypothetical protein LOTGIDRAFT_185103 [Lottia gigantea]
MAARFTALCLNAVKRQIVMPTKVKAVKPVVQHRNMVTVHTETGGFSPKPEPVTFSSFTRYSANLLFFTIVGFALSKVCASLLDEHDIFSFDEDDD